MTWGEAFTWDTWVHSVVGGVHFIMALIALVLGPIIFLRGKGTKFHRQAGYVFVLCMLTVNTTALTSYDFTGRPNLFHFFAVLSLAALLPGFYFLQRAVRTGRQDYLEQHAQLMMWAYYGLFAAGVAQVLTRVLPSMVGDIGRAFMYMGVGLGLAGFACSLIFPRAAKALAARHPLTAAAGGEAGEESLEAAG